MKKCRILGAMALGAIGLTSRTEAVQPRPNIIFILTDDQRWDALGCNSNTVIKTPNIDAMARDGVNFKNSFVTTPICCVSRATILTGQYMRTHGIRNFNQPFSPEQMAMTYPCIMRRNGYFTGFTGKWGVGAEPYNYDLYKNEFDFWRGQADQDEYWRDGLRGTHQNVRMSDDADDFMARAKASGKPFCLSISYKAPHGPWDQCQPDIFSTLRPQDMPIPETFTKEAWDAQPDFIKRGLNGVEARVARDFKFEKGTNNHHQHLVAQYYALIQGMDASVGRIRESLKKYGFDTNTILIFTSDNGHFLHEKGLYGKWLMYEQSIKVPLVIYNPQLPLLTRGQVREEQVLNVDIAPTILSLAGLTIPEQMQGADLSPLLRGERPHWREDWFCEHTYSETGSRTIPKSLSVRTDNFKYIRYISEMPAYEQLFDLKKDTDETNNLAQSSENKETMDNLRARCDTLRVELKDNVPDYQEYQDQYLIHMIGKEKANNAVQFAGIESLGQTFKAETGFLTSCEFVLPTWGRGDGPCDVIAELVQGGTVLRRLTIAKDAIENTRTQRLMFETPVKKGESLYLRLIPIAPVSPNRLAWRAYNKPIYAEGTAYIDDQPQSYSHELTLVFKKQE
jgi:arylsulfatase A-like enzyme